MYSFILTCLQLKVQEDSLSNVNFAEKKNSRPDLRSQIDSVPCRVLRGSMWPVHAEYHCSGCEGDHVSLNQNSIINKMI